MAGEITARMDGVNMIGQSDLDDGIDIEIGRNWRFSFSHLKMAVKHMAELANSKEKIMHATK